MCVEDVACWFLENRLILNPTKTEAVLFGTKVQHDKITMVSGIDVEGTVVPFRDTVTIILYCFCVVLQSLALLVW